MGKDVLVDLKKKTNIEEDEYIFLAGNNYRMFLTNEIKHYKIPLKGLTIGRQLSFLKNHLRKHHEEVRK